MDRPRPNYGYFGSEEEALTVIVGRLRDALDPEAIWLFGSRARGDQRPDSDFDFLVVTKSSDGSAGYDYDRAYAPIRGTGVGCDVVPCLAEDFDDERHDPTSLCYVVTHEGRRLYERA